MQLKDLIKLCTKSKVAKYCHSAAFSLLFNPFSKLHSHPQSLLLYKKRNILIMYSKPFKRVLSILFKLTSKRFTFVPSKILFLFV